MKTTLVQKYGACGYDDVIFFSTDDAIEVRAAAARKHRDAAKAALRIRCGLSLAAAGAILGTDSSRCSVV